MPVPHGFGIDSNNKIARMISMIEALERYSCMHRPETGFVISSLNELTCAMDPREMPWFKPEQYYSKDFVCVPFSPNDSLTWLEGRCLVNPVKRWILSDLVVWPSLESYPRALATSSGTAAHWDPTIATLFALDLLRNY